MSHSDELHHGIVVTWPKTRLLNSYLSEVRRAKKEGKYCYFRIRGNPLLAYGAPCYHVYDGRIRGSMPVLGVEEVKGAVVQDPITGNFWPAGTYLVRSPEWTPVIEDWNDRDKWKMQGFRGYRYFDLEPEYV